MKGRRRLIYVAALAAAVAILVADRFLLSHPALTSAAAPAAGAGSGADPGGRDAEAGPNDQEWRLPFPAGVQPAAAVALTRDPFALPVELAALLDATPAAAGAPAADGGPVSKLMFERHHQLKGVIRTDAGESALVGDDTVDVGETYHGAVLLRVTGNEAYFQCVDGEAVLRVPVEPGA
jgi:hypothetical protein